MVDNNMPLFYSKLKPEFKKEVDNLISKKRTIFIYRIFEWACVIIALMIILMNINSINNSSKALKSIFLFCISYMLIITANEILKKPKKDFEKAKQTVKNEMLFNICTCKVRCRCRDEFREYIKNKNIDLFKEEK